MKALDKKRLWREIERERRARVKARLAELRELIAQARAERRAAISIIRHDCREQRIAHRIACRARVGQARTEGAERIHARRRDWVQEKTTERLTREADLRHQKRAIRSTARERRQESDDEVRGNIPPDLVPIFDQIRRYVRPGPRRTRTEAFLEWVEENPGEIYAMQQRDADRWLAQLLAEQAQLEKVKRKRGRALLEAAPF